MKIVYWFATIRIDHSIICYTWNSNWSGANPNLHHIGCGSGDGGSGSCTTAASNNSSHSTAPNKSLNGNVKTIVKAHFHVVQAWRDRDERCRRVCVCKRERDPSAWKTYINRYTHTQSSCITIFIFVSICLQIAFFSAHTRGTWVAPALPQRFLHGFMSLLLNSQSQRQLLRDGTSAIGGGAKTAVNSLICNEIYGEAAQIPFEKELFSWEKSTNQLENSFENHFISIIWPGNFN